MAIDRISKDMAIGENCNQSPLFSFLAWLGELGLFCCRVIRSSITPPYEWRELLRQMDEVGTKSVPLVALAGAAAGAVFSLQTRSSLVRFGAKALLPVAVIMSITRETGPIITALVVCGRVAAGIGAELGSMKVTEQIEAIEASAVDPYKLLAATRVFASILMLPLLTIVADFCAIISGWLSNTLVEPMSLKFYLTKGLHYMTFGDLLPATVKTAVFGLIIGMLGCFQGMRTTGGTEGVGRSATSSVVLASLFVIFADVLLVQLTIRLFG